MTSTQLFKGLSYIDSSLLTEAEQRMSVPVRKTAARPRHTLLAAVICLITLLLAGCGVLYMLRLQNLKIGTQTFPLPQNNAAEPASEESVSELLVFSLQGAQNSPNFLANQEWLTFTQNYTPVLGDYWDSPEEYWAYSVQDQAMVDKLDEICAKYGLKVIGKSWHEHVDCSQFLSLLGVDSLLRPNADATLQIPHGRFFPGGSFTIYGSVSIAGTDCTLGLTYHCVKKDVFYDVFGYVDPNSVKQRNVITPEGIPLLLLESENSGLILADKEDCFLSLGVSLTEGVSLEQVADCFNFAIQTSPPDAAAAQAREQESIAQTSMNLNPRYTTFQSYIEARLSTDAMLQAEMTDYTPPKEEYAFYDLDGNGVDELLIFYDDGYIGTILVMKDGEVTDGKSYYMTLCEDNVLIHISDYANGETMYHIFRFANDGDPVFSNPKERSIVRLLKKADGTWQRTSSTDHYAEFDTEITEEEALSILNTYTPIQLDKRPLSQFQEQQTSNGQDDSNRTAYQENAQDLLMAQQKPQAIRLANCVFSSLQSLEKLPMFQANQEWLTFTQNYTPDWNESWDGSEDYWAYYFACSHLNQEILDKVDEICAKFGLKIIGKPWFEHIDCNQFLSLLGVDSLLRQGADATLQIPHGRFFPGGSFTAYGTLNLAASDHALGITYHCVKKDVFYDVFGDTDLNSVTQRNVITPEGIPLLLLESEADGMILADRDDSFLFLRFDRTHGVSLEEIAACFDFSIQISPPDAAAAQAREQESKDADLYPNRGSCSTYKEFIENVLWGSQKNQADFPGYPMPEYAFYDLDGNGVDELLLCYDGYIDDIYVMKDGEVTQGKSYHIMLCEDNVLIDIGNYGNIGTDYHIFRFANDGDPVFSNPRERSIVRLLKKNDGTWQRTSSTDHYAEFDTEITEEEALSILNAYTPVQLDTRPLSQFQEQTNH